MHAIVSLLDKRHSDLLEALWRDLESECGLTGVSLTPHPHFSWHIAAEYQFKQLAAVLPEFAAQSTPFNVRTSGLGIFTGPSPVIYVRVIKSPALAAYHRQIWEVVQPLSIGPSPYYEPDAWVPHITLAFGDVTEERLACAMPRLAPLPFEWELEVDHLALVSQFSGQIGKVQEIYTFNKEPEPG